MHTSVGEGADHSSSSCTTLVIQQFIKIVLATWLRVCNYIFLYTCFFSLYVILQNHMKEVSASLTQVGFIVCKMEQRMV